MADKTMAWSSDGETFNSDSLEELLDSDDSIEAGRAVYFGEAVKPGTDWVGPDDLYEMIAERAYDVGGEHAEDFPNISHEANAELAAFLTAWQAKHCVPTFWTMRNVKEYTVTEADMAGASK